MNLQSRIRKLEKSLPPRPLSPLEIFEKYCPGQVWDEELDIYGNLFKGGRPAWTIDEDLPEPDVPASFA